MPQQSSTRGDFGGLQSNCGHHVLYWPEHRLGTVSVWRTRPCWRCARREGLVVIADDRVRQSDFTGRSLAASRRTTFASKSKSMSRQSARTRARVNCSQITRSPSLRSTTPSGRGMLPIGPWKPATAAVVEFLSGRDFMGYFRKRNEETLGRRFGEFLK